MNIYRMSITERYYTKKPNRNSGDKLEQAEYSVRGLKDRTLEKPEVQKE